MLVASLSLSFFSAPLLLLQEPATAPQKAVEPLLFKVMQGTLAGKERGLGGPTEGWVKIERVMGNTFLRMSYHQFAEDGSLGYQMVQLMKQGEKGLVEAWHFDAMGGMSHWQGNISERGLHLETKDEKGVLAGTQTFEWENGGYQFRLRGHGPDRTAGKLVDYLSANYQPTTKWQAVKVDKKEREELMKLPYAWYLGTFRGKEVSIYGNSEGVMKTELSVGPWFQTHYQTLIMGQAVFTGIGFIKSSPDGSFENHWFEQGGGHSLINGKIATNGDTAAVLKNADGKVIEKHQDVRKDDDRYTFTIHQLDGAKDTWNVFMTGQYVRQPK